MNEIKGNIISSIFLQIVTIVSGLVVPKIILVYFGSGVNGLVSSINQFLNYVTLLEGGIGSVIMAILYKPLYDKDTKRISQIVNATTSFFRKLSFIYIIYVTVLSLVYPLCVDTGYSFVYSVSMIWVLGLNLFSQYFLSISFRLLLNADRKVAYVSLVQAFTILLNLVVVVITVRLSSDLLIIKAASAIVFFLQPLAFHLYVKKHYSINRKDGLDTETVKHRWDGLGINTAFFIHSNTDMVILTVFASLTDVSIYAVYMLVVKALKNLVSSISSAITPSFGNVLASGNLDEANKTFSAYEFGISIITTFTFTCGMILITPFIDVYTAGINDADYHQQLFGILIVLSEMIYCYRDPYVSASYAAGHIKQVTKYSYIEAAINIVTSLVLVRKLGLTGVAIGTILAMIYREVVQVFYLKKHILYRPLNLFFKNVGMNSICIILAMTICFHFLNMSVVSYWEWVILAIKASVIVIALISLLCLMFYRDLLICFAKKLFRRKKTCNV